MKKYKLLIVDEPDKICGMVMGQGITFSSKIKCQVNHQGVNNKMTFQDGQLFVSQSRNRAFVTPMILTNNIDGDVIDKWLEMSQNLQDWTRTSCLAKRRFDEGNGLQNSYTA